MKKIEIALSVIDAKIKDLKAELKLWEPYSDHVSFMCLAAQLNTLKGVRDDIKLLLRYGKET